MKVTANRYEAAMLLKVAAEIGVTAVLEWHEKAAGADFLIQEAREYGCFEIGCNMIAKAVREYSSATAKLELGV